MDFLKRYPIPIAGLILGLFTLGNLIQSYSAEARLVLGAVGIVLYVLYLLRVLVLNVKLSVPLENLWYAGVIGHVLLIVWFIMHVGIDVASVPAPSTGQLAIGQYAFWFGLVTYVVLLAVVCRRVWFVGGIPAPAMPTTVMFAAPASLLLAGYMV